MKRTGIILLVFLLILPFAFSTSVFDGRLYDDEPKEINGQTLKVSSAFNRASVTYGTHKIVAYVNKCSDNGYYEFCVRKTEEDLFTEFSLNPKGLDILFEKKKDPATSDFALGDPVVIKLEVKNDGELSLDFSIIDDIADMEITRIDNLCYKDGDKIVFNYTIRGKDITSCSYRVKLLKSGDYNRKAVMTFFDGTENKKIEKSSAFDVKDQGLKIDVITNKQIYEIGEKAEVTIKFNNLFKEISKLENVDVTPFGMTLINLPQRFNAGGKGYFNLRDVDIPPESSMEFKFEFNVTNIDNSFIINSRALTLQGFKGELITKKIDVASIRPDITLQRISDTKLKIHIQNINSNRAISNLKINLKSNYQNLDLGRTFSYIAPGGKVIMDITLKEFDSRPTITYPLFASGSYETQFGEGFTFSKALPIDLRTKLSQPVIEEPENIDQTKNDNSEKNLTESNKTSFSFKSLFSKLSFFNKKEESNKTNVIAKEENSTSKLNIKEKLSFLKPTKKKLIVIISVIAFILIVLLIVYLVKRNKKIKHIEIKLADVKL